MEKAQLRIVYMGTPEFAVAPLAALIENNFNIAAVITMPDKPAGRGHKLQASAVKQFAIQNNIPVLQPEKLKDENFITQLKNINADLFIVVAFRMLPEVVWNMPPMGTFNLHASLLPQYRGAAPINWAIINGETNTGVSTFFLTHEIDNGDIIMQKSIEIEPNDNAGILHDKLMVLGAKTVVETVEYLLDKSPKAIPQSEYMVDLTNLKLAPKIFKETCRINWQDGGQQIVNFIKGLSPYPSAYTIVKDAKLDSFQTKILNATFTPDNIKEDSGTILSDNKTYIKVAAKDGWINIHQLQPSGKKIMTTEELLRGFKLHLPQRIE